MTNKESEEFMNEVIMPIIGIALATFGLAAGVDYAAQLVEAIDWLTL